MKSLSLSFILICAFAAFVRSQGKPPRFSDYPAAVETARVRSINFAQDPDARMFRTRLSEALRRGVNFAGRYVLATWGCGTGCISGAIIDGRTGKVHWPEELAAFGVGYTNAEYPDQPLEFQKDSRLLILRGIPGMDESKDPNAADKPSGDYYYDWKNGRLVLVRFDARPEQ
ncbi:MAG: hypothetical protein IPM25_18045 [Chloracidobacterium sp.]|nr:hypothetical protein [Chloracidobacterium sp.]